MRSHKQSGFVLVIGLMLLTVASGAVVSSMSVNKYQERQAGNYVRTNNYEAGADEAFRRFSKNEGEWSKELSEVSQKMEEALKSEDVKSGEPIFDNKSESGAIFLTGDERKCAAENRAWEARHDEEGGCDHKNIEYTFTQAGIKKVVKIDSSHVRVEFWGERELSDNNNDNTEGSGGQDILSAIYSIKAGGAYQDVLLGCEGVQVSGGGGINGNVRTLQPGAGVRLSGDANVDGNVTTMGTLYTDSSITGNILAGDDITLDAGGGYAYGGSIATTGSVFFENSAPAKGNVSANGDVEFNNAATVTGNVSAGGKVIFSNSSASVGGDIESQEGTVNTANGKEIDKFAGGSVKVGSHTSVSPVSGGECDPKIFSGNHNLSMEVSDLLAAVPTDKTGADKDITVGSYPTVDASLTPGGLSAFDETWNVQKDVTLAEATTVEAPTFDKPVSVIRTKDFTQKNGELNVSGGDVVLLVDGDLTLGSGGGKGLTIDSGSTLTIFVTGETHIKSSTQMADVPATTNGRSTLSLYSNHKDSDSYSRGVLIDGSAQALANIYAPYANVSVTAGGGLRGSARGKTVTVDGGGEIEYVPRSTSGGGDGSGDNGDDNSSASGWSLEGLSYGSPEE
ncbi:polymer-forming cytoskeletal protein [Chromohalobacter sp. TMW 2.2308]|uniref:polymer-forming cytoskeletal protein n=1 Tax=Chromohalobacter TaxID=42054 RepID=UPI001FFD6C4F|nr:MULTISPECIES: polymer-forming cytoskeletal protein [Chromohalobacter]MCK2044222.1 polymer-forming cytoskeletal protein [Chromohalobacter moromii]MCT8516301.1 polymer-forming cytoskeletal protein [Chromohalobacter sp. TMW 2.2271]